jgi:hypothetical protein
VRVFLRGDPEPIGEVTANFGDVVVPIDRSRLVVGGTLVASQELGLEVSPRSPKGHRVEEALNLPVEVPFPLYACAQSLFVRGCCAGSWVEVWQGGTAALGSAQAIGSYADVRFSGGSGLSPGAPVEVRQYIYTSPKAVITSAGKPLAAPGTPQRALASPTFPATLEACQRLVPLADIVPGALVQFVNDGGVVWNDSVPRPERQFLVDALREGDQFHVTQSMRRCQRDPDAPNSTTVQPLTALAPPVINGPLCTGARQIRVGRLKPPAILRLYADGAEIGAWEAGATCMPVDIDVPVSAITARQELCGIVSPTSRPYYAASGRSGRWFVVENHIGADLEADAFAIHAALVHTGHIVIFSGDQHNRLLLSVIPIAEDRGGRRQSGCR